MDPAARFQDLLLRHSQEAAADRRQAIEEVLWRDFGAERAVLVLDMSGFSALAQRHGIVHYLSMVRRMQLTAEPVVDGYDGTLVKFEADNCYAMFPDVGPALRAARDLHAAFAQANAATPDELDIRIACGIDHGRILVVPGRDFYGVPVNQACKLGEDLARAGEILLTDAAMARLADAADVDAGAATPLEFELSGIRLHAWRLPAG
jgi:class 3 adenylate cyclase